MTSDLREQENREELPEVPAETSPVPPPPEPEKTVFGPSLWEQVKEARGSRGEPKAAPEDAAARRAEKEAQRQEKAAEKEAKKLELKIAQEQRKAQEEQRRQETRARDQERRQQSRQKEEEERQRRREEKARSARVRRVGTMTLGVALIAMGVAILLYMLNPNFDIRVVSYLAPVILISLGVEVLIRQFFSKDRTYKYDFASGIICIFLVLGSFCISLVPYVVYYISPERFASEEQQLDVEREKLYRAFKGDPRVRDYYVNGGISGNPSAAYKDENGNWAYQLDYLHSSIYLMDSCADEAEFARTCRELLDKMAAQDFGLVKDGSRGSSSISFDCGQNAEGISYNLTLNNRLKLEMDAQSLAKLVEPIYSRPTRENGWIPAGYDDILASWGQPYAEHFAWLMENQDPEIAGNYYTLLMDGNYEPNVAESYYLTYFDDAPAAEELPAQDVDEGEEALPPEDDGQPDDSHETIEPTGPAETVPQA